MARPLPSIPHPSVPIVEADGGCNREWRNFFSELSRRVPVTGTATFAAATTVAVTFAPAEMSTEYNVFIEGAAARDYWPSGKAVTGFTINASAVNSDTVNWTMFRK
jgi:hypothetical protein